MKILCLCNGGHVRSPTLARLLTKRGKKENEVLSCGADDISSETLLMLCRWAEIIYSQKDAGRTLQYKFNGDAELMQKIDYRFDVGPDDWKTPEHPDLLRRMRDLVEADPQWSSE